MCKMKLEQRRGGAFFSETRICVQINARTFVVRTECKGRFIKKRRRTLMERRRYCAYTAAAS